MAEKWINGLGSLHQFKNVDYVKRDLDGVQCLLCGTGRMDKSSRKSHFNGSIHLFNYNKVLRAKTKYEMLNWCQEREQKIKSLGLPRWRQDVQSNMFKACSFCETFDRNACFYYAQKTTIRKERITKLLQKYEHMEITSLLELALWKSNIISSDLNFSSMQEMREYPILDSEFNPEEYAFNKRMTCGSAVVIPLVMSFLW